MAISASQPGLLSQPPHLTAATSRTVPPGQALRILQVIEPGMDGAFNIVASLVRELIGAGHHVALAYSDRRAGDGLSPLIEMVRRQGGECLNLRVGNAPEPADARALVALWKLVRQFKPDAIHAHSSKAGALARALRVGLIPTRIFYSPHAYYGLSGRTGPRTAVFNFVERMLGGIGHTFMSSQGEAEFGRRVLSISPERSSLMNNSVDTTRFLPVEDRAEIRRAMGLPVDGPVLGWVGRLTFQKDPQTCYRALAPILRANPRLTFLQLGKGELDSELRDLAVSLGIENRIVRHEYFSEPWKAYQAMDGLIMTSRYEGLSLVMIEALASNLPLILSDMEGVSDLAPQRLSHCWISKVGNIPEFTDSIAKWLADLPTSRPCNHRDEAISRFSVDRWLAAHLSAYRGGN